MLREDKEILHELFPPPTQVGSYYGASLAVCDVDGDSVDELLVGAPQWQTKVQDEGQVFIYKQNRVNLKYYIIFFHF